MVSKGTIAFFVFLSVIIIPLITWGTLAYSGCTPKNDGYFGSYCNPFPFGAGGSCGGGSSGNGGKGTCSAKTDATSCTSDIGCNTLTTQGACNGLPSCCDWQEGYRRFNRSPRREGYRRFARR